MPIYQRILAELIRRGGNHLVSRAVKTVSPVSQTKQKPILPDASDALDLQRSDPAPQATPSPSLLTALSGAALTRLATRSVPGAILIGGGLLAKLAYDRKRARRGSPGKPRG